jgi:predicted CxxxxCH...CXXCH cytochrome family protein
MMVQLKPAKTSDSSNGKPLTFQGTEVVFDDNTLGVGAGGFAMTSGTYAQGLCNNCHTGTTVYTSTGAGASHSNAVCTGCHKHDADGVYNGETFKNAGDYCNDCHSSAGGPTPGTTPDANHDKHIDTAYVGQITLGDYGDYSANDWYEYSNTGGTPDMGCGYCHPQSEATHGSMALNMDPTDTGATGTLKAKNHATETYSQTKGSSVTCSSVYCHSDGYDGGSGYDYKTTPDWYGGTFTGDKCANCHGNSPSSNAHSGHVVGIHYDGIYTGSTGLATAGTGNTNSHGNASYSTTINCNLCHYSTVTSSANDDNSVCSTCHGVTAGLQGDAAIAGGSTIHVDGTPDVAFNAIQVRSKAQIRADITTVDELNNSWTRQAGYKTAGANDLANSALNTGTMWNGASNTCSDIACHNGHAVTWEATDVNCNSCHTDLP